LDLRLDNGRLQIVKEGKNRKFVSEVEHVTFSGRRAKQIGQKVIYVTERCVLRLGSEGLEVFEIAPGIDLQRDILEQTDTPLRVAKDLKLMDERLFRPEPLGLELGPKDLNFEV
jgi:propionate CoA-transferase